MQTLKQAMIIQAPITTIWAAIIHHRHFATWSRVWHEQSHFSGTWQLGAQLQFSDGTAGVVATVTTYDFPQTIGLQYTGVIEDGEVVTTGPNAELWCAMTEAYTFQQLNPVTTRFEVTMNCRDDLYLAFEQMWAQGLIALKHFCEQPASLPELTIGTTFNYSCKQAWYHWLNLESITVWNHASADWYCPKAVHDFRVGGTFSYTMAAKDDSFQFDFSGIFTEIVPERYLALLLDDGRRVHIHFIQDGEQLHLFQQFEAEQENPLALQQQGWQAILDNFTNFCLAQPLS
ncbi:MAG: SRPBCC domain-containing protein [Culicoidibacterales bacterium]